MLRRSSIARVLAVGGLCALGTSVASAASLQQVPRATWGASGVPSYVEMYIYAPDALAATPPVLVVIHPCAATASALLGTIAEVKAAADTNGFILVLPQMSRNCWDVGSTASLTHDGGGDTHAVAQMVDYTLSTYDGDASRVYAMGASSGGMMVQALLAVYPDVFRAGASRAGVAAGCWASSYDDVNQWSNPCSAGSVNKTASEWGNLVRAMFPSYSGHRPRVQLFHGTADSVILYQNLGEAIEEWTNVLTLSTTPTSTDTKVAVLASYDRKLWDNSCGQTVLEAWTVTGGTHSTPSFEQAAILDFFGLDPLGPDPETNCSGGAGGSGGSGGAAGSGGSAGTAGTGGTGGGAGTGGTGGSGGRAGGGGSGTGGSSGTGGATATGGMSGMTSTSAGGASGSGDAGEGGSGAESASGGRGGSGGTQSTGGNSGGGGSDSGATGGEAGTDGGADGSGRGGTPSGGASSGASGSAGRASGGQAGRAATGGAAGKAGASSQGLTITRTHACLCRAPSGAPVDAFWSAVATGGIALIAVRRRRRGSVRWREGSR